MMAALVTPTPPRLPSASSFAPAVSVSLASPRFQARGAGGRAPGGAGTGAGAGAPRARAPQGVRAMKLGAGAPGEGGGPAPVPAGSVRLSLLGVSGTFNARAVILGVPLLWGSFPAVGKLLYRLPWALDPVLFNALRMLVSSACVLPTLVRDARARRADRRALLLAGAELGLWTFLGSTLQIVGLRHTTASKAAFLTQLQTVLVPLFAVAVGAAAALSWHVWAASALALSGVALLTLGGPAAGFTPAGDGLMLLCAVVSAVYVLRTRAVATRLRPGPLVAYKVAFQCVFAFAFAIAGALYARAAGGAAGTVAAGFGAAFATATPAMLLLNLGLVVWAGAFISAMSTWLHVRAGSVVPAPETAVIFSFTPLVTGVLSIFLGERFGVRGILGGALIILSTILSSRAPPPKAVPAEDSSAASLPVS